MSTVSLMPVGKKISIKRSMRIPITSALSTSTNLKASGNMLGDYRNQELILDEGAVIRVDAFSAVVKAKGYPATKITVFPDMGKAGTVYVSLDDLDGLSWESVDEGVKKKPSAPTRRIDVSINDDSFNYTNVWHAAFKDRHYVTAQSELVVINPLELSGDDLEKMMFSTDTEHRIGEAIVKIGRESWTYQLRYKIHHAFDLGFPDTGSSTHMKLLSAKFSHSRIMLQIQRGFGYDSKGWEDIVETMDTPDKFVRAYLEEKHPK